jgi:hypothetical protein
VPAAVVLLDEDRQPGTRRLTTRLNPARREGLEQASTRPSRWAGQGLDLRVRSDPCRFSSDHRRLEQSAQVRVVRKDLTLTGQEHARQNSVHAVNTGALNWFGQGVQALTVIRCIGHVAPGQHGVVGPQQPQRCQPLVVVAARLPKVIHVRRDGGIVPG